MLFSSWLRNRTPKHSTAPRFRPQLEALDGRDVPSTLTVTSNLGYNVPGYDVPGLTLRDAIADAHSGDVIVFDPSLNGQTIHLASNAPPLTNFTYSQLVIDKNLDIEGPGAGKLAIDADHLTRVFEVRPGVQATIAGLTIKDGNGQAGYGFDYMAPLD